MALIDSYNTGDSDKRQFAGAVWNGQVWTASQSYTLTSVKVLIYRVFTPSTVTVHIRNASGYLPTGADLASETFDGDTLTTSSSGEWKEITFNPTVSITTGQQYAIILSAADYYLEWRVDDIVPSYTGGQRVGSTDSGSSWTGYNGDDFMFEIYGDAGTVYAEGTKTVTAAGTASLVAGPGKATTPGPTDDQTNIYIAGSSAINAFTWVAPVGETPDYLVYFRASGGTWALQETITDDSTTHYLSASVRGSLSYYSIYEWRVDTRDPDTLLVTTGDTWTFITQVSPSFTDFTRRSDYDADQVWQPGTGWVDINSFEFTGGGRYKGRIVVVGHQTIYFGDL